MLKAAFKTLLVVIVVFMAISACIPKKLDYSFPPSNAICPVSLDWKSIQPGKTTRQDVLHLLGKPDEQGTTKYVDGSVIPYFAYKIEGGEIARYMQHRIYFRSDGKVDWIEVIVADYDGKFHPVREVIDQLGDTLDTVYNNSTNNPFANFQIDVKFGPDQIYVWSECGMALVAMNDIKLSSTGELDYSPVDFHDPLILNYRYPEFSHSDYPVKDLDRLMMMKFLFSPTTFENYLEKYSFRIRFGLWDEFLRNRQK